MSFNKKKSKFGRLIVFDGSDDYFYSFLYYDYKDNRWARADALPIGFYKIESKLYKHFGDCYNRYDYYKNIKSFKAAKRYYKKHFNELKNYKVSYEIEAINDIYTYKLN